MSDDRITLIAFIIVTAIIFFTGYMIATSDLDPWIKFWLLR